MRIGKTAKCFLVPCIALILYLALSLIFFGTRGDYTRNYLGQGGDPLESLKAGGWRR